MKLPLDGIEYLRWVVNADGTLEDAVLDIALKDSKEAPEDSEWFEVPWADEQAEVGTVFQRPFRLLLAGPEAGIGNPGDDGDQPLNGAIELSAGTTYFWIRVRNTPEVIIRQAGRIKVTD